MVVKDHRQGIAILEVVRILPRQGMIECGGQAPEIARLQAILEAGQLLAWHEKMAELRIAGGRQTRVSRQFEVFGQAKVADQSEPGSSTVLQKDVLRLQIAVDETLLMGVLQGGETLQEQWPGLRQCQAAAATGHGLREALSAAIVSHEVEILVRPSHF